MQKANEWLLANGFIEKITRGRRSRENQIRLHEAHLSGVRFSDWEPKEGTDSKGEYATTNARPVKANAISVAEVDLRFPKSHWQATARINGKAVPVGMAEICHTCQNLAKNEAGRALNVSLTGHLCEEPTVTTIPGTDGPVPVTIEPRTRKLPLYPWS